MKVRSSSPTYACSCGDYSLYPSFTWMCHRVSWLKESFNLVKSSGQRMSSAAAGVAMDMTISDCEKIRASVSKSTASRRGSPTAINYACFHGPCMLRGYAAGLVRIFLQSFIVISMATPAAAEDIRWPDHALGAHAGDAPTSCNNLQTFILYVQIFVHVACGRGSLLLWRRCDKVG